jgi:O-antigen/teichoic acid export membrane protein
LIGVFAVAVSKIIGGSLLKSSGIYTLANLINSAIPFLMLPVLTRYLTPFDYGIVAMFQVLLGIMGSFTGLSVHGAVARQYYDRDSIDFPNYVGNCLYILGASTALIALVVWIFARPISNLSEFPVAWLWSVVLVCVGQFVVVVFLTICQVQVKPFAYGRFQVSLTLVNVTLSLFFVVSLGMGWEGRIQGQIFAYAIFATLAITVLIKQGWVRWSFRKDYIRSALNFGVPLIPHAFGMWAITMTDRILITRMVGVTDTGIYVVGAQIGMIIGILQDSFNRAWIPWLYDKLKREDPVWNNKIVRFTYLYDIVILILALLLAWIAPWFLKFYVGKSFVEAGQYVFWIALGYAFNGMYKMVGGYLLYEKKTFYLSLATFFTALINIIVSYFLIRANGPVGAAQGTMVAFLSSFLLTWFLANKCHRMPWSIALI